MNRLIRQLDHTGVLNSETGVGRNLHQSLQPQGPSGRSRGLSDSEARLRKQGRNVVLGYSVHIAVDASSEMPLAVTVEPPNVNEKKAAPDLLHKVLKKNHKIENIVADSQYSSESFRDKARSLGAEPVIPCPKNKMKGKQVLRVDRKFHTHGPARLRRLYRKRSSIGRTVSRLKIHFGLCQLRTRGLKRPLTCGSMFDCNVDDCPISDQERMHSQNAVTSPTREISRNKDILQEAGARFIEKG